MYGAILVIYCNANNPAEKHASCTVSFILDLQWGRNVVTTLWLTNQKKKHRILRTTIGPSQSYNNAAGGLFASCVPTCSYLLQSKVLRIEWSMLEQIRVCCRFVCVAMPQHAPFYNIRNTIDWNE